MATVSKAPTSFNLVFKSNYLGVNSWARKAIIGVWDRLSYYFMIDLDPSASKGVTYSYDPSSKSASTGGNYGVQLRGKISDELIMHETLHALGFGHNKLLPKFSVMGISGSAGPALRIQDFIILKNKFGARESPTDTTIFSWGYDTQKKMFWAQQGNSTRNLFENFLYDFAWNSTGYNILDFRNYKTPLLIDLRASEYRPGTMTINEQRLFGTRTDFTNNWFGLNIINVPGAKLDEAWAGSGNDVLTGNQLDNKLSGNAGKDTLRGLGGNDLLDGGSDIDTADYAKDSEEGGSAGVIVNLSKQNKIIGGKVIKAGTALDGFGSRDTLVSIENIIGTAFADYIIGSDDANVLVGGAGNDTLVGGDGIDTVDYSGDRVAGGTAPVFVSLLAGTAWDSFGNQDKLVSIENVIGTDVDDLIIGDGGVNVLEGRGGADSLNGAGGADLMIGGKDNDTYSVDDAGDQVVEKSNEGRDTVITSVSYTLADNVEDLTADSLVTAGLSLTGNSLFNHITGSRYADTIEAGLGMDTLDGGMGNDILSGGRGSDIFIYGLNYGADVIRDFSLIGRGADKIAISKTLADNFDALMKRASQAGPDLVFDFGAGNTLTLQSIASNRLSAQNVTFF